jgi:adenylate cyclase
MADEPSGTRPERLRPEADAERAAPSESGPGQLGDAEMKRSRRIRRLRRMWRSIPSPPRCKMCTGPFGGPVGTIRRLVGLGPWPGNPKYCKGCFKSLYRNREGAEMDCTLLFADIRGSTSLAETMRATEFRSLMDRFYAAAAEVLIDHEAIVDKFVGDEVIGIFVPAMTEGNHAAQAIDAAVTLLRQTGNDTDAPWAPIGIGINSGVAYVGVVGTAEHVEFTALGDNVNVTARLASEAGRGEALVTRSALRAAGRDQSGLEQRRLNLRGRSDATDVYVLTLAG